MIHKCVRLLALLAALICAADNSFASDNTRHVTWELNDFSLGLQTKPSPFAIPKGGADVVENITFEEGNSISKRGDIKIYSDCGSGEEVTGLHRMYRADGTKLTICNHGDEIESKEDADAAFTPILNLTTGDRKWQWLTWHDLAIGTDGSNQPVKYDGSSASATYIGSLLALDLGSGAGPNGTYTYKVACYTASYLISLDVPSNTVVVSDNDIDLTMIPICMDTYLGEDVIGRKIYRTVSGGSTYKLLSNGTIADNSTTNLTDSDADGALGVNLSPNFIEKPPLGRFIIVHGDRLWLADNASSPSRIYYSDSGSHDVFESLDSYFDIRKDDGDKITAIKDILGILTVFKNNSIQKIYTDGDDPDADWSISDPLSFTGCQAPYSAINTNAGVMYLGNNGIYIFNGQYSQLISEEVTPEIRDISASNYENVWSEFFKNSYYMAYTSEETGSSVNDRILKFDTLSKSFSLDTFGVNVFSIFGAGTDIEALYSGSSENGYVYAHTDTEGEVVHKKHDDFTGTFDDMRYIPVEVGGDANDPVIELAWDSTIDSVASTIDSISGIIDRPDTNGTYTSQVLNISANTLDKLYWNETIPTSGGDVQFYVRTGATTADTIIASWSGPYTNSAGSDISAVSASGYLQYRVDMTTDNINFTPNLVKRDNYVVRLTFGTSADDAETSVPFHWRSGWIDFGYPEMNKELRTVTVYYDWPADTDGTLSMTFENYRGESDVFDIDLREYPTWYKEQFTGGSLIGENFRIDLQESSLNHLKIRKIVVEFDVSPPQFYPIQ